MKDMETAAPFAEVIAEIKQAGGEICKLCFQCGKCDVVCPWNRVREFSMRRMVREASFGLTEIESDDVWRCTTCGTCPDRCPRGVKQIEVGIALRRLASSYDVFPASAKPARAVRGSLTTEGNPLNEARAKRADWAKGLPVKPFAEGTEYLLFGCCYSAYDPRMKKVAAATARILEAAGVDFGILGTKESCCGESIRKTGAEDVYKGLAKENIKAFVDAGVRKIVVSSPHCYEAFKNEYAELMVRFEVVHMAQLLAALVAQGRLRLRGEYAKKVAYHDPCYLGRHNGVYDEPRAILGAVPGLELVELPNSRRDSLCCGGGGGRVWMDTPKGERFSNLRLQQALGAGAEVLATFCPYCITMFEDSRLSLEVEEKISVKDVTEIVAEML
jgi:Fe-S oxidoreductase